MYKTAIPVYKKCKNMTYGIEFQEKLVKMNNLTGTQKLEYALQMAESIAVLNNFEKGVIVHDDVQLVQFLLAPNGKLKLVCILHVFCGPFWGAIRTRATHILCQHSHMSKQNDFNRMEVMYFDEENQEYCRYRNNPGHGPWRAPEEYYDVSCSSSSSSSFTLPMIPSCQALTFVPFIVYASSVSFGRKD